MAASAEITGGNDAGKRQGPVAAVRQRRALLGRGRADMLAESQPSRRQLHEGHGRDARNRDPLGTIDGVIGDDDVTVALAEIGGLKDHADGAAGAGGEYRRAVVALGEVAIVVDAAQVERSLPIV